MAGFAGGIDLASSMFRSFVAVAVISARTNGISIDDIEDPGIRYVAVLSWRATAELLLQLVTSRWAESADRVCGDLTR